MENPELLTAVRELTTEIKELKELQGKESLEYGKPLTPEEAAAFLSVPLGTFRHWQTDGKVKPMTGFSAKHPRYDKADLLEKLRDGFVESEVSTIRAELNKRRRKR